MKLEFPLKSNWNLQNHAQRPRCREVGLLESATFRKSAGICGDANNGHMLVLSKSPSLTVFLISNLRGTPEKLYCDAGVGLRIAILHVGLIRPLRVGGG